MAGGVFQVVLIQLGQPASSKSLTSTATTTTPTAAAAAAVVVVLFEEALKQRTGKARANL